MNLNEIQPYSHVHLRIIHNKASLCFLVYKMTSYLHGSNVRICFFLIFLKCQYLSDVMHTFSICFLWSVYEPYTWANLIMVYVWAEISLYKHRVVFLLRSGSDLYFSWIIYTVWKYISWRKIKISFLIVTMKQMKLYIHFLVYLSITEHWPEVEVAQWHLLQR